MSSCNIVIVVVYILWGHVFYLLYRNIPYGGEVSTLELRGIGENFSLLCQTSIFLRDVLVRKAFDLHDSITRLVNTMLSLVTLPCITAVSIGEKHCDALKRSVSNKEAEVQVT